MNPSVLLYTSPSFKGANTFYPVLSLEVGKFSQWTDTAPMIVELLVFYIIYANAFRTLLLCGPIKAMFFKCTVLNIIVQYLVIQHGHLWCDVINHLFPFLKTECQAHIYLFLTSLTRVDLQPVCKQKICLKQIKKSVIQKITATMIYQDMTYT